MKVLRSILLELADLPDDVEVLTTALNSLGMAVDGVEVVGQPVEGVVTARILRMEKHPDAAKVTRCWVDAGDGQERHVWCGATNMQPGDVVPLATIGTAMPDGREISRRGILGIDSEGMLCSPVELGISQEASGLLILDRGTPLGANPFDVLGIEHDVVFELDLTRNRPECWGHLGIARDLAAHFGRPFRGPRLEPGARGPGKAIPVTISAPERCGMFSTAVVSNVEVGPSPHWVASRLSHLGMRPINNVVDASNLVMLELNQPNHAYDAAVVSSFDIRMARDGEVFTTLDEVERHLSSDDLVICDASDDSIVGLAGVMGGLESEVTSLTTELSLEIAYFHPDPIRFSAQRHNLRSEASARFERGVDPHNLDMAFDRFVTILRESSPRATLHSEFTVQRESTCPGPISVRVRQRTVRRVLGIDISAHEIDKLISPIGFVVTAVGDDCDVVVPTYRPDCVDEIDIVEEIARHYGYDNLGKTLPRADVHGRLSNIQRRRRILRNVLVGLGLDEVMPNPFLAPGDLTRVGLVEEDILRIENPLVSEESVLRTSLRPGILKAIAYNISHRAIRIGVWEIGHVYPRSERPLPDESEQLCVMVVGADATLALHQWNTICDALGVGAQLDQSRVPLGLHPTRSATLARGKQVVGVVGEIDPGVLTSWGIDDRVSCLEVDLSVVLREEPKAVQAREINRYPSSDIDLAFVLDDSVTAATLHRALRQGAGADLVNLELFDVYRGELDSGSRSLAFRLRLQKSAATLTEEDIATIRQRCIEAAAKVGAKLRT